MMPSESARTPKTPVVVGRKFKKSGMTYGAMERYLVPVIKSEVKVLENGVCFQKTVTFRFRDLDHLDLEKRMPSGIIPGVPNPETSGNDGTLVIPSAEQDVSAQLPVGQDLRVKVEDLRVQNEAVQTKSDDTDQTIMDLDQQSSQKIRGQNDVVPVLHSQARKRSQDTIQFNSKKKRMNDVDSVRNDNENSNDDKCQDGKIEQEQLSSSQEVQKVLVLEDMKGHQEEPKPRFNEDHDNQIIDYAISRKGLQHALIILETNLENNILPSSYHARKVFTACILNDDTRIASSTKQLGSKFIESLFQRTLEPDMTKYLLDMFNQNEYTDENVQQFFWERFKLLVVMLHADATSKVATEKKLPLKFFKKMNAFSEKVLEVYLGRGIKVHKPFFINFVESLELKLTFNCNLKFLIDLLVGLGKEMKYRDEFSVLMDFICLIARFFQCSPWLKNQMPEMARYLASQMQKKCKPRDYIPMLMLIKYGPFGKEVAHALVKDKIDFEVGSDFERQALGTKFFLEKLSTCERIKAIKLDSHFKNRHSAYNAESTTTTRKRNINAKGESSLHILCGGGGPLRGAKLAKLEEELQQISKSNGNINPLDNCGNTPLHDAARHNRYDAIIKFRRFYESAKHEGLSETKIPDLLAKTSLGDTPLNLAAQYNSLLAGEELLELSEILQNKEACLNARNYQGETPFDSAHSVEFRKLLMEKGYTGGGDTEFNDYISSLKPASKELFVKKGATSVINIVACYGHFHEMTTNSGTAD